MTKDIQRLVDAISDVITSADPYADGKQDGDQMVQDLLDIVFATRGLDAKDVAAAIDQVKAKYQIA